MALSANTVLEVRRTGSDTNGGGFVTGTAGFNYSLYDTATVNVADAVANGTTTITSATANFVAAIGNLIYLQGGSGSLAAGWYQIMTNANTTTITVDRAVAAGTGITLKLGGALATPGQAAAIAQVAGIMIFIKYDATPYVITTASTNVSGGCISGLAGTFYSGYDTTRSHCVVGENRPTLQLAAGVSTATIFGNLNADYFMGSLIVDGNGQTASKGCNTSGLWFNVKVMNCLAAGIQQNGAARALFSEVVTCQIIPLAVTFAWGCYVSGSTNVAVAGGSFQCQHAVNCISVGGNRSGFVPTNHAVWINCIAYGNVESGFNFHNSTGNAINCIAESNGAYGYRANTTTVQELLLNCADYNNSLGRNLVGRLIRDLNPITGSGSFFANAAGGNFALNNIAGAGAAARAAGFPAAFIGLPSSLDYSDLGAVQHQDSGGVAGGLIVNPGMRGGMQ